MQNNFFLYATGNTKAVVLIILFSIFSCQFILVREMFKHIKDILVEMFTKNPIHLFDSQMVIDNFCNI